MAIIRIYYYYYLNISLINNKFNSSPTIKEVCQIRVFPFNLPEVSEGLKVPARLMEPRLNSGKEGKCLRSCPLRTGENTTTNSPAPVCSRPVYIPASEPLFREVTHTTRG